jgi:hypothetical protein
MSDMKKLLESLDNLQECPPDMGEGGMMPPAPMDQGTPVTVNVSMNASGKEHVEDLLRMMQQAGLGGAQEVKPDMMPVRQDMERLRAIVGEPEMEADEVYADAVEEDDFENATTEPDEEYSDHEKMTRDLSGGINREKKAYKAAQRGDNAMAVEAIKAQLMAALSEKKKPDADGDGVPDWADKKPGEDDNAGKKKGSKPKKGEVPPQFKK